MVTGWIPMPHSHLLVRGSRPYLTGHRRLNRRDAAADSGTNLIKITTVIYGRSKIIYSDTRGKSY